MPTKLTSAASKLESEERKATPAAINPVPYKPRRAYLDSLSQRHATSSATTDVTASQFIHAYRANRMGSSKANPHWKSRMKIKSPTEIRAATRWKGGIQSVNAPALVCRKCIANHAVAGR